MTTPYDIITRAMKDIGALASDENPTADEAQDGLDMLNDMIAQWSNEIMTRESHLCCNTHGCGGERISSSTSCTGYATNR